MRLVLWCSDGRGDYLGRFSLMLVEANGLSVGVCLFGLVIWVDYFVLLGNDFLGKMMGARVVIEVVIEVVVLCCGDSQCCRDEYKRWCRQ